MNRKKIQEAQKEWEENTLKEWVERHGERRKAFFAYEDTVPIKTVYTPLDLEDQGIDFLKDIGYPGEFPYTRGVASTMYRGGLWRISQYSGYSLPEESNKLWRAQIDAGLTAITMAFDLPT